MSGLVSDGDRDLETLGQVAMAALSLFFRVGLLVPCLSPVFPALTFLPSPQVNKTLKATLQALLEVMALEDGEVLDSFQASPSTESLKSTNSDPGARQAGRRRGQQQETETFYITVGRAGLKGRGGVQGVPKAGTKTSGLWEGFPEATGVSEWTEHPCQAAGQA